MGNGGADGADGVSGRPTLDDVARVSGVSRAAASRALNGRDGVRDDVRGRVEEVAASLGYRPNLAARHLASGRSSILAFVMPTGQLAADPYCAELLEAVATAADRHGEALMVHLARTEPKRTITEMQRDGLIGGVIVSVVALGSRWIDELIGAGMPTVVLGGHTARAEVHAVRIENRAPVTRLVEHLHAAGCRRIAYLGGKRGRVDALEREQGYRDGLSQHGLPFIPELAVAGDFDRHTALQLMPRLLEHEPDAIVAVNDESAIAATLAIRQAGLRVPQDVAVVGFDGIGSPEARSIGLTTVCQPFDEMGELAVQMLIGLMAGDEVPMEHLLTPTVRIGVTSSR